MCTGRTLLQVHISDLHHFVAEFREDVYDHLSQAFDDPSATIVYPYVYRILNARPKDDAVSPTAEMRPPSPAQVRPATPQSTRSSTFSSRARQNSAASRTSTAHSTAPLPSVSGRSTPQQASENELELEDQLNTIWMKASAAENGAMHKDAINDLWNFIKTHPQMKPRVDAMIDGTGGVYMRYIRRALASRQAEDDLRSGGGSQSGTRTLSELIQPGVNHRPLILITVRPESMDLSNQASSPMRTGPGSPRRSMAADEESAAKMRHYHDMFNYSGRTTSIVSNGSSRAGSIYDGQGINHPGVQAHLESLRKRDSMAFTGQ